MAKAVGAQQQIIMNYTVPPGVDEIEVMANALLENLPEELLECCEGLAIRVEEFPDDTVSHELELEDEYDLLALYRSGKEIAPGVVKKTANDDDILIIYRRPLLDMWCESCDDLMTMLRGIMIEELGRNFEFSDDDIEEMGQRHFQGML